MAKQAGRPCRCGAQAGPDAGGHQDGPAAGERAASPSPCNSAAPTDGGGDQAGVNSRCTLRALRVARSSKRTSSRATRSGWPSWSSCCRPSEGGEGAARGRARVASRVDALHADPPLLRAQEKGRDPGAELLWLPVPDARVPAQEAGRRRLVLTRGPGGWPRCRAQRDARDAHSEHAAVLCLLLACVLDPGCSAHAAFTRSAARASAQRSRSRRTHCRGRGRGAAASPLLLAFSLTSAKARAELFSNGRLRRD